MAGYLSVRIAGGAWQTPTEGAPYKWTYLLTYLHHTTSSAIIFTIIFIITVQIQYLLAVDTVDSWSSNV